MSIDGEAATEVEAWSKADPTVALTGPASDDDKGNMLSFKTATGMTASASPSITITQNGVSNTFAADETGLTIVTAPIVTAVMIAVCGTGTCSRGGCGWPGRGVHTGRTGPDRRRPAGGQETGAVGRR